MRGEVLILVNIPISNFQLSLTHSAWVHQYKYKYWINQGASNMLVFCADDVIRWTLYQSLPV